MLFLKIDFIARVFQTLSQTNGHTPSCDTHVSSRPSSLDLRRVATLEALLLGIVVMLLAPQVLATGSSMSWPTRDVFRMRSISSKWRGWPLAQLAVCLVAFRIAPHMRIDASQEDFIHLKGFDRHLATAAMSALGGHENATSTWLPFQRAVGSGGWARCVLSGG